jgi:hypothetical protein
MIISQISFQLFFLDRAKQRVFVCACYINRLFGFHIRYFVWINARHADAFVVDLEHNRKGFGVRSHKDAFKDEDDELHRRKIVVVQNDFEELRLLKLSLAFSQNLAVVFNVGEFGHIFILPQSAQRKQISISHAQDMKKHENLSKLLSCPARVCLWLKFLHFIHLKIGFDRFVFAGVF